MSYIGNMEGDDDNSQLQFSEPMLFDKGRKVLPTLDIVLVTIRKYAHKRKKKENEWEIFYFLRILE